MARQPIRWEIGIPFIIAAVVILKWLSANEVRDCLSGTLADEARDWYSCHHCSCRHTQVVHLSANEVRDCLCGTPANQVRNRNSCHHCSHCHIQVVHLSANEVRGCLCGTPANQVRDRYSCHHCSGVIFKGYTYQPMRWEIAYIIGTLVESIDRYSCHHCSRLHTQVVHLSANEVRDCQSGTPAKQLVFIL